MPTTQSTQSPAESHFIPWSQVEDRNLAMALLLSGGIAYHEEKKIGVYFHNADDLNDRTRFVVCPLGSGKPLFWFYGTEEQATALANRKYAAWQRRKERQATQRH